MTVKETVHHQWRVVALDSSSFSLSLHSSVCLDGYGDSYTCWQDSIIVSTLLLVLGVA
jgi:hypothetical protein